MLSRAAVTAAYIVGIALAALVLATLLHVPHGQDHWSGDWKISLLSPRPATQHTAIALVYISETTLQGRPYTSPVDRGLIADLVRHIDNVGAKVIGLDFVFDRPTEPTKDASLAEALRTAKARVVIGTISEAAGHGNDHEPTFEQAFIEKSGRTTAHLYFGAHHSPLVISDNVVRTTFHAGGGSHQASFAEALARAAGVGFTPRSDHIAWLKPPRDGSDTFLTLPAEALLAPEASGSGQQLARLLKDRIVLVGGEFYDRDQHLTPFSIATDQRYPGLSIHAQILAQYLDGRSIVVPGRAWHLAIVALLATLGFLSGRRSGSRHLIVELTTVVVLILLSLLSFRWAATLFPFTSALFAWIAGAAGGHYGRRAH